MIGSYAGANVRTPPYLLWKIGRTPGEGQGWLTGHLADRHSIQFIGREDDFCVLRLDEVESKQSRRKIPAKNKNNIMVKL